MDSHLSPRHVGLVLGATVAIVHIIWAAMVALNIAQPFLNFVLWVHFIKPIYIIEPFEFRRAVLLVVVTGLIGFAFGSLLASIWTRLRKSS